MQWKEFKRIVEEELRITDETEVWKINVNPPVASEFLHVERDTLLVLQRDLAFTAGGGPRW